MSEPVFARTPRPPYWAVIFTSLRREGDDGYSDTAARMVALAARRHGFLGAESTRGADGLGITVSYWASEADIAAWKADAEHRIAQERGRSDWYAGYVVRIACVERDYDFHGMN